MSLRDSLHSQAFVPDVFRSKAVSNWCRMMQALVDRLVPLLLQQLLRDYDKWVKQQRQNLPEDLVPS